MNMTTTSATATHDKAQKKDTNKVTRHTTTLRFETEEDLLAALGHYGLDPRGQGLDMAYFDDDGERVSYSQMLMLKKHCLPFTEERIPVTNYTAEGDEAIQKRFNMKFTPSCSARFIAINTYDLNARQHQAEVRKLLRPIRWAGYRCSYDCNSETTNNTC